MPWTSGGTKGSGGADRVRAPSRRTRARSRPSRARRARRHGPLWIGWTAIPAITIGPRSCSLNSYEVTTPKPAAAAQAPEQVGVLVLAGRDEPPSAVTTCAEIRLSHARPYLVESQAYPPPSVNRRHPWWSSGRRAWRARRAGSRGRARPAGRRRSRARRVPTGSTCTPFIPERSIRTPSSQTPVPATLWPPQRTRGGVLIDLSGMKGVHVEPGRGASRARTPASCGASSIARPNSSGSRRPAAA